MNKDKLTTQERSDLLEQTAQERLDLLTELESALNDLQEKRALEIEAAIHPKVRDRIAAIKTRYADRIQQANVDIANTKVIIKVDVLVLGSTVKGAGYMAVWSKGRVTWDGKGLAGYMVAHPEVEAFRKEGKPSVSIRRNK